VRRFEARELLAFAPDDVLALVGDVRAYPRFLPWMKATRLWDVRETPNGEAFKAEAIVGYKAFRGRFSTTVDIDRTARTVATRLIEGPFRALHCLWRLSPSPSGCMVDVAIDFEFSEPVLQSLLQANMDKAVAKLMQAFTAEAEKRYAKAA
jgi:coenzyme Q-binding protein COQ10